MSARPSNDDHFAGSTARTYDADHASRFADDVVRPAVDVLAELAGGGDAFELAIGTGRIAIPLGERGLRVDGVDLSVDMLTELRAKPGGAKLNAVSGDMATIDMGRTYSLAYLVFNTIGNLMTQQAQAATVVNAARHLEPGGHFVVECIVPDQRRLAPGSNAGVFDSVDDHIGIDQVTDFVAQQAVSRHVYFDGDPADRNVRYDETPFRWVWPSELDLMAQLGGMQLQDRWADWDRSPFTADSTSHVSVWQRQ